MPSLDAATARRPWRVVAIFVALLLVAVALASCSDDKGGGDSIDVTPDPEDVETSEVVIQDLAFDPKSITTPAGNVVQWTNRELTDPASAATGSPDSSPAAVEHTVTADDDGKTFDSGPLGGEATFAFTFLEPGTYKYHCSIHPAMKGAVTIT